MSKIGDYFALQCGNPHGVIGKIMTWAMNRANSVMYKGIVDELKISPKTRILDVGFGNGYFEKLIIQKSRCFITGIDISEDMKKTASKRNKRALKNGQLFLEIGDCCALPYDDDMFSAVSSINTIYFWSDTVKGLSEIRRVLKKGKSFYNLIYTKEWLGKLSYTEKGFKKFEADELVELGKKAGFQRIRIKRLGNNYGLLIVYMK